MYFMNKWEVRPNDVGRISYGKSNVILKHYYPEDRGNRVLRNTHTHVQGTVIQKTRI
jgi:hypothetical protein